MSSSRKPNNWNNKVSSHNSKRTFKDLSDEDSSSSGYNNSPNKKPREKEVQEPPKLVRTNVVDPQRVVHFMEDRLEWVHGLVEATLRYHVANPAYTAVYSTLKYLLKVEQGTAKNAQRFLQQKAHFLEDCWVCQQALAYQTQEVPQAPQLQLPQAQ